MGVTEISLHFRKGEDDKYRSRKAARCGMKESREGEMLHLPVEKECVDLDFFIRWRMYTYTYMHLTDAFEETLEIIIYNNKFVFNLCKFKIQQT